MTSSAVREQIHSTVDSKEASSGQASFTPLVKSVFETARTEAFRLRSELGHDYVGTEHLLLALVKGSESQVISVLDNLDVDPSMVRREVARMLNVRIEEIED